MAVALGAEVSLVGALAVALLGAFLSTSVVFGATALAVSSFGASTLASWATETSSQA